MLLLDDKVYELQHEDSATVCGSLSLHSIAICDPKHRDFFPTFGSSCKECEEGASTETVSRWGIHTSMQ